MRKRTVRTGLRFMIVSGVLLLLGAFYSQQINALFAIPVDGAFEFVKLAFFWSGIFGASGVVVSIFGLMQRTSAADKFSLAPALAMVIFLILLFFALLYRTVSLPPVREQMRPGETLHI